MIELRTASCSAEYLLEAKPSTCRHSTKTSSESEAFNIAGVNDAGNAVVNISHVIADGIA